MMRIVDDIEGNPVEVEIVDPHEPYHGYYYIHTKTLENFISFFDGIIFRVDQVTTFRTDECEWWVRI